MWEKEKLLVTSNFSFSHSVFKRLLLQTHKIQGLFGKGLSIKSTTYIPRWQNKHFWQLDKCIYPGPMIIKSFFMLNSAEHEISMLDKSHLITFLGELLIDRNFHRFCLSNQTFKFDFSYTLKHQWDFKVWALIQWSTDSSFISTGGALYSLILEPLEC